MKNSERTCWIIAIILLAFFCDRKMAKVENMESLVTSYDLNNQIKSDQIIDLMHQINNGNQDQYRQGFEEGKVYAMIAAINNEDLHKYADGYHAAMSQMEFSQKVRDYNNSNEIYSLFFEVLNMLDESDHEYQELLNLVAEDGN
jgi:hypothetical protein